MKSFFSTCDFGVTLIVKDQKPTDMIKHPHLFPYIVITNQRLKLPANLGQFLIKPRQI